MDSKEIKKCKICDKPNLSEFISFGKMPVANAFLDKENLGKEEFKYPMGVSFCPDCKMVQLTNIVPYEKYIVPDDKGNRNYAFFSSTSKAMEEHFAGMAKEIEERFLDSNSKVLEIGSNDGIMLQAFKKNKVLGIEPSHNVAKIARSKGIETITEFFDADLANKISEEKGKYKTITSTNVFLNIINIHSFLKGVYNLLDKKGVFITEDPYIQNILSQKAYDQIYDEHIWYFSLHSLENLLNMNNMEIFDAEEQWVHGGSMRVYACKKGDYKQTDRVKDYIQKEKKNGIDKISPYLNFSKEVKESKEKLSKLLQRIKEDGKKIVGYGASSKGTIVCNYCDIGTNVLDYITDSTPYKQGLYSPGKHIPIVSPEIFHKDNADYALLFIPNHLTEVMGKEKEFLNRKGKFITHWPEAKIIENGN
ncbi:class I SAM-dependent methyltransferase [Candidatus Pacearchaeota archaeon]|nr:class I SAM-dependent methyltransferase [Candidatus Pacearchaeota archaeon]